MAASRFVNVSEEEMNIIKENAIPKNTKNAAKFGLTLDSEHAQSDGKSVNRGLPVIFPEVAILGADRKERGLWGQEW